MRNKKQGYIPVTGGNVWYEIVGKGKGIPLIVLHGGPGHPHYTWEPLRELGKDRPIIFYDQLGCGKSDRPKDISLWREDRFVDELEKIRKYLGLQQFHILGHSWGGALAAKYIFKYPKFVKSIIFASPLLNTSKWLEDADQLKKTLPMKIRIALNTHEQTGTTNTKEYKEATQKFYRKYLCRIWPQPMEVKKSQKEAGDDVYLTMWGPSEFHCTGNLKNLDCTSSLHKIKVPILFTCGKYDEATPSSIKSFQKLIPSSRMVIFKKSAHLAQLEETEKYIQTVRRFLNEVD